MFLRYFASIVVLLLGILHLVDATVVLGCWDMGDIFKEIQYYIQIPTVIGAYLFILWYRHRNGKTVVAYDFAPVMLALMVAMGALFVKKLVTMRGSEVMVATDLRDVWSAKLRLRTGGSVIAESVEVDRFCRHEGTYHWVGDTLLLDDALVVTGEGFFANMYVMDSAQKFLVPIENLAGSRRNATTLSIVSRVNSKRE